MYTKLLVVLLIFNIEIVTSDCGKDICVSDFLKDIIKNEETAVFKNHNGTIVEEEIEIVDLQEILKDITDLLTKNTNTTLVKNFENKTYVFVKTFDLNKKPKDNLEINYVPLTNNSFDVNFNFTRQEKPDKNIKEILKESKEKENEISDDLENLNDDFNDDNSTDYPDIDYIEIYKDVTIEEFLYIPTEPSVNELNSEISHQNKKIEAFVEYSSDSVKEVENKTLQKSQDKNLPFIPWIATIFVVNQTNNFQFDYLCDGILVSENTILTGARCVHRNNSTVNPEDLLIVLGKKSLQSMDKSEEINKIKHVIVHANFTNENNKAQNDLAMLVLEESIVEKDDIKVANISDLEDFDVESEENATTAWSLSGDITPIYFEKIEHDLCGTINEVKNTICTTYGNDVALCPSYGGLYAAKIKDEWYLRGVFYGDPADRGICFNKSVLYTSIESYLTWIMDIITSYQN